MYSKPFILKEGYYTKVDLDNLKNTQNVWAVKDIYIQQLTELFEITHPEKKTQSDFSDQKSLFIEKKTYYGSIHGNWIYFPWNGNLIHTLNEYDYFKLRTNRNQNIINSDEQKKLYASCIGFLGLSIGSHMALALTYIGIGKSLKLAEFDTLETSNLNRVQAGLQDIGSKKLDLTIQKIYEIDPYASPKLYSDGLNEHSIKKFFHSGPKPSVIFEAIDDFKMKIKIRLEARRARVPIIMLTNLGDSILIDIERYDVFPNLPLFNGRIRETPEEILNSEIGEKEKIKFSIKIVGIENLPTRVLSTLFEINKTLVGRPQIYSTVTVGGGIAGYIARKIILGENLKSNRIHISFDSLLGIENNRDDDRTKLLRMFDHILS